MIFRLLVLPYHRRCGYLRTEGSLVQRELSAERLTEGLSLREQPLRAKSKILPTSPYTGEAFRCGGAGQSESFLEPPALPVVFFVQKNGGLKRVLRLRF